VLGVADPDAVLVVKTVEKALDPPEDMLPLTTLQVASLNDVSFVQLVGALEFSNSIIVPDAIKSGM
jgi:hypothetical protein